eukprot:9885882-Ditylum_brightwellii.AAC.1
MVSVYKKCGFIVNILLMYPEFDHIAEDIIAMKIYYNPTSAKEKGHTLDETRHCNLPYGAYAQVINEAESINNVDNMRPVGAICLGPVGNWTQLPIPNNGITRVDALGLKQKQKPNITITDCDKNPIPDDPISATWLAGVDDSDININKPDNADNPDNNDNDDFNPYNACSPYNPYTDNTLLEQVFDDNNNIDEISRHKEHNDNIDEHETDEPIQDEDHRSVTTTNWGEDHRSAITSTNDPHTNDATIDTTADAEDENNNNNNDNEEEEDSSVIQQLEGVIAQTEETLDAETDNFWEEDNDSNNEAPELIQYGDDSDSSDNEDSDDEESIKDEELDAGAIEIEDKEIWTPN